LTIDGVAARATDQDRPAEATGQRVFIRSYGCQMNVYDAERMADALSARGYASASAPDEADVVILNTCHIREKAAEKIYSELGRLRDLRTPAGAKPLIGVVGCLAQAEGEEIVRRQPAVDFVVGPQTYHRLGPIVAAAAEGRKVVDVEFPAEDKFDHLPRATRKAIASRGRTAFLTVQEGCDKFCSFCVVPYTRGAEVSRPVEAILDDARALADAGVREITLLGQNVSAYHGKTARGGTASLADLLADLAAIEGLDRLRYTTSHPRDMDAALIAAHRDIPELMPYLHLPVQSGSDAILKAMNRGHTAAHYLEVIAKVRAARPDMALSGDFIVGFPGESDADFEATLQIVEAVGYASAFSFKYSPRPGTPAADRDDQVPEPVKKERLARLQALLSAQSLAFNEGCVGRTMPVLLEKPGKRAGQIIGRSPYLQPVVLDAAAGDLGAIVDVTIASAGPHSLVGRPASAEAADASAAAEAAA